MKPSEKLKTVDSDKQVERRLRYQVDSLQTEVSSAIQHTAVIGVYLTEAILSSAGKMNGI